ncbi:MAG: IS66 family transposase [Phaeodactylibacter sp.]|nr:IS66 family transposase [Phaeodactylibacter sp.]
MRFYSYFLAVNREALIAENKAQKAEIAALRHELDQLKRLIFGSKRERFIAAEQPEQLALELDGGPSAGPSAEAIETITYQRRKKPHPGRTALPDDIPTEETIIEPEEDTTHMKLIGEEVTETVDYRPGVLLKRRYIRRKYARLEEPEGRASVVIGELPERPIPKGIAEAGLLAHLIVSKYVDHLPFYRQIEQFKRNHGWAIHKSTLNDWFAACCSLLDALYQVHLRIVMTTDYLQADESPTKVQDSDKKGKTHQGYMWVYRNPANGLVLFDYRKGRGMHGPKERLAGFTGTLQCDGYKVYRSIARKSGGSVQLASCLAHIRRKFHEAREHHPELAGRALQWIQQLYALERHYREAGLDAQTRQVRRDHEARPVFDELLQWVIPEQANNLSKGPIGKALHYAKEQLPLLAAYLDDGRLEIDNNLIENAIRPLALGRKNYLFAGSHQGAQRTAMMYSFFASCKVKGINPWEWLRDVLQRVGAHPVNRLEELLPHQWKPSEKEEER